MQKNSRLRGFVGTAINATDFSQRYTGYSGVSWLEVTCSGPLQEWHGTRTRRIEAVMNGVYAIGPDFIPPRSLAT